MTWQRVKYQYRVIDQRAGQDPPPLMAVSIHHGVVPRDTLTDDLPRAEDLSNYKVCEPGDLVLNRMRAFQGAIGISPQRGIVSPDYLVLRPGPDVDGHYLHHLFRSTWFVGEMVSRLRGIGNTESGAVRTPRINPQDLGDIAVDLPPLDEQRRIADFLDAKTARIDRLVDAMSESLDLLEAKRRALLMSTLPSSDCTSIRLGYYLDLVTSGPRGWGEYVGLQGTPFFRSANLRRDGIEPNLEILALADAPPSAEAEAARSRVRVGDVLIGITGANTGWVSLADQRIAGANVSQHVCLIRPGRMIEGRWLAYALCAPQVQEILLGSQYGGTKTQLSLSDIRDLVVPLSSLDDQQRIMKDINDGIASIMGEHALRERQIALLAERRQALITAAVTGGITV
jgi:type I restriction enzyme, S subunit